MPPRHFHKGKELPPVALGSSLAREKLPAPLVYYPNQGGVFFAFAAGRDVQPALCTCAEGAVRNLIRLAPPDESVGEASSLRLAPLDYGFFPDTISRALMGQADPVAALYFRRSLCHRCNLEAPTFRYCRELEGPRFVQTYGWYINQTYLRLGIHPTSHRYLPDVCPPEYHDLLHAIQALSEQARDARARLVSLMNSARREIPQAERSPLEAIEQKLNRPRRELGNAVQNITRAEFGVRAIGEGWVSETQIYRIVCRLFPEEQILRHYRPEWMDGLELDVYLPGRKLAIEYQGQQHFHPIKPWGGMEALLELQARDARKVQICRQTGVHLVIVDYTEPLTDDYIRERLGR